jgi:hypothetical protein
LRDLVRITEGVSAAGELDVIRSRRRHARAILLLKPYKRIPGLLLAVVAATIVVGILNLDAPPA